MSVESIRLLGVLDAFIGDTVMVSTRDVPDEGTPCRLAGIHHRPSMDVLHDVS